MKDFQEVPVIRENVVLKKSEVPNSIENLTEIPGNIDALNDRIEHGIIDETNDLGELKIMLEKLETKKALEITKKYNSQIKHVKRQIHNTKYPKIEEEEEKGEESPQFYSNSFPQKTDIQDTIDNNEFFENFTKPTHKKELYNALLDIYVQYRDKSSSMNIAPVKKELKVIFSSPNITNGRWIKHFARQTTEIIDHKELIQFLRSTLLNFTKIFAEEISSEENRTQKVARELSS